MNMNSPILILEGLNDNVFENVGMKISSIYGALAFISYKLGIAVIPTRNLDDTAIVIERIAFREGTGDLLAEGSRRAAARIGKGSERFAMHVKGLELPGYILRGLKSAAVGFSVSTRGGCHLRNAAYGLDMKELELSSSNMQL